MHRDPDFLPARGIQFARLAIAKAAGTYVDEQLDYAARRWGTRSTVVQMLKADVRAMRPRTARQTSRHFRAGRRVWRGGRFDGPAALRA